jgi:hypothetical protein
LTQAAAYGEEADRAVADVSAQSLAEENSALDETADWPVLVLENPLGLEDDGEWERLPPPGSSLTSH